MPQAASITELSQKPCNCFWTTTLNISKHNPSPPLHLISAVVMRLNCPILVANTQTPKRPLIQRLVKANNTPNSQLSSVPCSTTNYELNNQLRPLFFESVCSFFQITFGYFSYYLATYLVLVTFPSSKKYKNTSSSCIFP